MTKLKRLVSDLNQMAHPTYIILRTCLVLTGIMLFYALIFTISGGSEAIKIAQELSSLGAVTLLIGTIAAAIVEERMRKQGD